MQKTIFAIQKMDSPSKEHLVRLKLARFSTISSLNFDIPGRKVHIHHSGDCTGIFEALRELNLDVILIATFADEFAAGGPSSTETNGANR